MPSRFFLSSRDPFRRPRPFMRPGNYPHIWLPATAPKEGASPPKSPSQAPATERSESLPLWWQPLMRLTSLFRLVVLALLLCLPQAAHSTPIPVNFSASTVAESNLPLPQEALLPPLGQHGDMPAREPLSPHISPNKTIPTSAERLRVGFFIFPPHVMLSASGEVYGAAVDLLVAHVAPRMNMPVDLVGPLPHARLVNDFHYRRLDAVLAIAKIPERVGKLRYPALPFWYMTAGIAVRNDFALPDESVFRTIPLEALKGVRIAYTRGAFIPGNIATSGATFDLTAGPDSARRNLEKLMGRRVDAVLSPDTFALRNACARFGIADRTRVVAIPSATSELYMAFDAESSAELILRYEQALREALEETPYNAILVKYLVPGSPTPENRPLPDTPDDFPDMP